MKPIKRGMVIDIDLNPVKVLKPEKSDPVLLLLMIFIIK